MRPKEEVRQAWKLWNLLTDLNDRLWEFYEDDFIAFYAEDEDEEWMTRDEDP